MTDKVPNPHDAFFKHYLSQPAVAVDFLRQYLPGEVLTLIDLTQLRLEKDTFVDEKLRGHFSDLIYSTVTRFNTALQKVQNSPTKAQNFSMKHLHYRVQTYYVSRHHPLPPLVSPKLQ